MCGLEVGGLGECSIRASIARRSVRGSFRALRASPASLTHEERGSLCRDVCFSSRLIHNVKLCIHDRSRLALIPDAEYFCADLKALSLRRGGQSFMENEVSLAIKD